MGAFLFQGFAATEVKNKLAYYLLFVLNSPDFLVYNTCVVIFVQVVQHNIHIVFAIILLSVHEYDYADGQLGACLGVLKMKKLSNNNNNQLYRKLLSFRRLHTRITTFIFYAYENKVLPYFIVYLFCTFFSSSYVIVLLFFQVIDGQLDPYYRDMFKIFLGSQASGFAVALFSFIPLNRAIVVSKKNLFSIISSKGFLQKDDLVCQIGKRLLSSWLN